MSKIALIKLPVPIRHGYPGDDVTLITRQAYLGRVLAENNISYHVIDLHIDSIEKHGISGHNYYMNLFRPSKGNLDYFHKCLKHKDLLYYISWLEKKIKNELGNVSYVGLNADLDWFALNVLRIIKRLNNNVLCIIGGRKATDHPHFFINTGFVDYVCLGYAEDNLPSLIKGRKLPKGVVSAYNLEKPINPTKFFTPDYARIKFQKYLKYFPHTGIISNFGCGRKCDFCAYHHGAFNVQRHPEEVVEEMASLYKKYGVENYIFQDSCINTDNNHLESICDEIINKGLKVKWHAMFRVSKIPPETIQKIARAGCQFATFGIETPRKRLQKRIGKSVDLNTASYLINQFRKNGILTRMSFMYDLPGETISDLRDCINFAKRTGVDFFHFNKLAPYQHTCFFRKSQQLMPNIITSNISIQRIRSVYELFQVVIKNFIAERSNRRNVKKLKMNKELKKFMFSFEK